MKHKKLTPSQAKYLAKSANGMTYKQISAIFVISEETVTKSLSEARKRLGAKNNLQCFALAVWHKELDLEDIVKYMERSTDA